MTSVTVYTTAIYCTISLFVGFILARAPQWFGSKTTPADGNSNPSTEAAPRQNPKELELMATSLDELTSRVDSQVGQHSLRVSEITSTLASSGNDPLSAGKQLIAENHKLQSDLADAKAEIVRQREMMSSCVQESRTDALTGIPNRRALDLEINRAFVQRRRGGPTFTLLMFDIDYFKRINDQYGHLVGDQLLKCISRCLTNALGEQIFVARFGGEEFVAVLRRTPLDEAMKIAEGVRCEIANSRYRVADLEIQITTSIGIKEIGDNETEAEFLQKADRALYSAKNAGRNRCYYHDGNTCHYLAPELPPEPVEMHVDEVGLISTSMPQDVMSRIQRKAVPPFASGKIVH